MQILDIKSCDREAVARMLADFRVTLNLYRGVVSKPNIIAAREELSDYACFPTFVAEENGEYLGYAVCRVDVPTVWVEQLYVKNEHRRKGVASRLFEKTEELALSYGEDMVYNYVHPNNLGVIAFLKKHGYSVLNLIEIRKPYKNEKLDKMRVGENELDY